MAYAYHRNRMWASESCMSVDKCTRTVGGVRIPHAVCVRHLRYVYTHACFLRCLYTYGRSLTGADKWRRSDAIATLGDGTHGVCTLTARPDRMPTRRDGLPTHRDGVCTQKCATRARPRVYSLRHFKNREHMTFSIGFVHAGPCACPHVSHWLVQYSILIWAGPDGSFVSTGTCNLEEPGSNPGRDGYLSSWLCICSAPNCSKAWGVQGCLWYCAL